MEFTTDILSVFDKKWALLTAGDKDKFNTMTVSWGGLGTIWGKPVATVYVRKSRYTHDFMEDNDYFTVSFYPEEKRTKLFPARLIRRTASFTDRVLQRPWRLRISASE